MKSLKKESRLRIPANKFLEAAEVIKGWRWLLGNSGEPDRGWGSWMGFTTRGLEDGGDTRMEVKITGEWGTEQGVPHTSGMMYKAATPERERVQCTGPWGWGHRKTDRGLRDQLLGRWPWAGRHRRLLPLTIA